MRFLALTLLVPCLSLACVERQESAPQQQATPAANPQAAPTTPNKPGFNPQGIPIKKGVGMPGLVMGNGPQASPPPPPSGATAQPAPSGSASK